MSMTQIHNRTGFDGYDGTQKQYDRTYKALDRLARAKAVPSDVQREARAFRDAVYFTGQITGMKDWIMPRYAEHMIGGSVLVALLAGLFAFLAFHDHVLLSLVAFAVATYAGYRGSRWVKRRHFLSVGKLPKA